jgi:SAGA-associated factor 29
MLPPATPDQTRSCCRPMLILTRKNQIFSRKRSLLCKQSRPLVQVRPDQLTWHHQPLTWVDRGEERSARIDDDMEDLLRDNIRKVEEVQALLQPIEGGNDVHTQMTLLAALRNSEEAQPSASRSTSVGHGKSGRDRQGKRKLTDSIDDRDSLTADSPGGPSPKVVISSQKDRLVAKAGGSRAGSVPVAREGSVKMEDDKDDSGKGKMVLPSSKPKPKIKYKTKR